MSKNSFASIIKNLKITRDSELNFTTGDKSIDKTLSLDNSVIYGNPESNAQINFAGMLYMAGLFGGKCTGFTAIPFGFLCELEFEKTRGLFVISENEPLATTNNFHGYNIENLIKYVSDYKDNQSLNDEESYFCDFVQRQLMDANKNSMIKIMQNIATLLKSNPGLFEKFENNLEEAIEAFDMVNSNNCNYNREALRSIILKLHIENLNEESALNRILKAQMENLNIEDRLELIDVLKSDVLSDSDVKKVNNVLSLIEENVNNYVDEEKVLNWIISGYLTHYGRDRNGEKIKKNRNIIHDRAKDKSSHERTVFGKDLIKILNSCSTDYVADRVKNVVELYHNSLINELEVSSIVDSIYKLVETKYNNKTEKEAARKSFRNTYGMTCGIEK